MKMHLFMSCLTVFSLLLHYVVAASAATVGLYAPDRYNGIPETCLMPMDFGYCRAKVKRYYFDMRRMKCAMFYFGGCAGNVNNFKSLEECNSVCLDGYADYDSPNDVVVGAGSKPSVGRDFRSRGNVNNYSSSSNNKNNPVSTRGNINNSNSGSKNNTAATSFGISGLSSGVDAIYKNTYNKYNTNTGSSNLNLNNSGSSSAVGSSVPNNNTKIIRSRSDDNVDEYDYEEEN